MRYHGSRHPTDVLIVSLDLILFVFVLIDKYAKGSVISLSKNVFVFLTCILVMVEHQIAVYCT